MRKAQIAAMACCSAFIALIFLDINSFANASRAGLTLFSRSVLPVLFPFFFVSSLLVELSAGGAKAVYLISLISGYPTGARMLSELYQQGKITRSKAIHIATYTSTCSPIYTIATLGAIFYKSTQIGITIFVIHAISSSLNGLLYKKNRFKNPPVLLAEQNPKPDIALAISNSLYSSIQNILSVGGLIVVFFILTSQIQSVLALPPVMNILISSILEMTTGTFLASTFIPSSTLIPLVIISFGGLAVAVQGFLFLRTFKMPFWFYLLYKSTHTLIAAILYLTSLLF